MRPKGLRPAAIMSRIAYNMGITVCVDLSAVRSIRGFIQGYMPAEAQTDVWMVLMHCSTTWGVVYTLIPIFWAKSMHPVFDEKDLDPLFMAQAPAAAAIINAGVVMFIVWKVSPPVPPAVTMGLLVLN